MKNIGAKWSLSIERGPSLFVFHAFVDIYVHCLPMCIPYCEQRSSIIYITHAHYHAAIHKKNSAAKNKNDSRINQASTPPEANRCVPFRLISTLTCEWVKKLVIDRVCQICIQRSAFSRIVQLWNITGIFLYSNAIDWIEWSEALPSADEIKPRLTYWRLAGLWWCWSISFWAFKQCRDWAALPHSAVWRTIILYKALSRLQWVATAPSPSLIQAALPASHCRLSQSKSHMQLRVLSEARVQAVWWDAETYCSKRMACFHQMFKRDHRLSSALWVYTQQLVM